MTASPNELAHALPAEPSRVTQASESLGREADGSARPAPKPPGSEEPQFALEPDLPTDGRDEVGEAMIRDLPPRPELSEPPSQPDPSHHQ